MPAAEIRHLIPQIGLTSIPLYEPADVLYARLGHKERSRLVALRHLGALSHALPGSRHTRWDYTVALLYYVNALRLPRTAAKFKIGEVSFTSTQAALQTVSLAWNVGHLPGTYPVEKGVYRRLREVSGRNPAYELNWPMNLNPDVRNIMARANEYLLVTDYVGLARVLAITRLLRLCGDAADSLFILVRDFLAPFMLGYDEPPSPQWTKLRKLWSVIRHVSYLTIDGPISGLAWMPSIPGLVEHYVRAGVGIDETAEALSEILSPIDRMAYGALYHLDQARAETAYVALRTQDHLSSTTTPVGDCVERWGSQSLFQRLGLGRVAGESEKLSMVASTQLRSHFVGSDLRAADLEYELQTRGWRFAAVQTYEAWNSAATLEPDETIIDVYSENARSADDAGKVLVWLYEKLDPGDIDPKNTFGILQKQDLDIAYRRIISSAAANVLPGGTVRIEAWPLADFGLFSDVLSDGLGGVWVMGSSLDTSFAKHMFRRRLGSIRPGLRMRYNEFLGLSAMRDVIRRRVKGTKRRVRWVAVTGSIIVSDGTRDRIEFDGGFIQVQARSGRCTLFALETKSGRENPASSLRRRLRLARPDVNVESIDSEHAYAEIPLR